MGARKRPTDDEVVSAVRRLATGADGESIREVQRIVRAELWGVFSLVDRYARTCYPAHASVLDRELTGLWASVRDVCGEHVASMPREPIPTGADAAIDRQNWHRSLGFGLYECVVQRARMLNQRIIADNLEILTRNALTADEASETCERIVLAREFGARATVSQAHHAEWVLLKESERGEVGLTFNVFRANELSLWASTTENTVRSKVSAARKRYAKTARDVAAASLPSQATESRFHVALRHMMSSNDLRPIRQSIAAWPCQPDVEEPARVMVHQHLDEGK